MGRLNIVAVGIAVLFLWTIPPAEAAVAYAPVAVVAGHASVEDTSVAMVAWVRGYETADYYRVYGVNGTALTFLAIETDFTSAVPAGYAGYGVSGVRNGIESELVLAIVVPCTYLNPTPPPPNYYIGECQTGLLVQD